MNAFPAELIQHHYACMLVAGLLPPQQKPTPPTTQSNVKPTTTGLVKDDEQPLNSVEKTSEQLQQTESSSYTPPQLPTPIPQPVPSSSSLKTEYASEVFPSLAKELSEVFMSRGRNTAWDPARSNSSVFHTVLVDHSVRLPSRKTKPTIRSLAAISPEKQNTISALPLRSPLSPLHPSSPLFPDGLIAPIWLRKHRELVPSVFVAFHCLAEHAMPIPPPTPPKDKGGNAEAQGEVNGHTQDENDPPKMTPGLSGAELKAKDEELIRIIAERKRSLSERGIKLTVVLLTTRAMLESSTLEQRLSFIRRSSQLDSKASLFVLTPVSKAELGDFVTSLQNALFDHALDYYREQFRRVRRKRQRYPPSASIITQIMTAAADLRGSPIKDLPLSKEGWLVRCDYKMGAFAEFGGNLDDALTHYTNAYQILCTELLTSTMLLPPRTKRWAEAKVLADTLTFRISKLLLYRNNGEGAWDHFRTHIKRFTELSQGWGIGEITFEFWSWLGKQYKLMGDLLDVAMREVSGSTLPLFRPSTHFPPMPTFLLHPLHLPTPTAGGNIAASHNPHHGNLSVPNEAAVASSVIPAEMCPGAGECFYIAGVCALERWERYKRLQWEQDQQGNGKPSGKDGNTESWNTMSITQESKVDHSAQAIEALTRAHEVFKRQRRHRLSLFVASKIANAYIEADQNELALRVLERTVKSYQFEKWCGPLTSQLLLSLETARKVNDVESEGKALWRLLALGHGLDQKQRDLALKETEIWLSQKEVAEEKRPVHIVYDGQNGPLKVNIVLSKALTELDGNPIPFQVQIAADSDYGLDGIVFDKVTIQVQDESGDPITMGVLNRTDKTKSSVTPLQTLDLRNVPNAQSFSVGSSYLTWEKGSIRVYEGSIIAKNPGLIQIAKVILEKTGNASVSLDFDLTSDELESIDMLQPVWFYGSDHLKFQNLPYQYSQTSLYVQRRKHRLQVEVLNNKEAYLDEQFVCTVKITNQDDIALTCSLDIHCLGPPGEVLSTDEVWSEEDKEGTRMSSLRDLFLGKIESGANIERQVFVRCKRHLASRTIDFVLHSKNEGAEESGSETVDAETVTSINLPVSPIFSCAFYAQWKLLRDGTMHPQSIEPSANANGDVIPHKTKLEEVTSMSIGAEEIAYISAVATINVGLTVLANEPVQVNRIIVNLDKETKHLRIWNPDQNHSSQSQQEEITEVTGSWDKDDRWGGVYDVEVLSERSIGMPIEAEDASLRPTGKISIEWQRDHSQKEKAIRNVSVLSLPLLLPPHLLSRLIVSLPSSITIEQPLVMLITIVNPSRLNADILINIDDSSSDFGIQSHRNFTVPNLLPRSTRNVPIQVIPLRLIQQGTASVRTLPRIRAWQRDRRQAVLPSTETANNSARTSMESFGGLNNPTTTAAQSNTNRQEDVVPIINQRPGAGVPLEVLLRYTSKTSGGMGTTAAGAAIALPSAALANHHLGSSTNQNGMVGEEGVNSSQSSTVTVDVAAHLQAETQRTGLWTVFVH